MFLPDFLRDRFDDAGLVLSDLFFLLPSSCLFFTTVFSFPFIFKCLLVRDSLLGLFLRDLVQPVLFERLGLPLFIERRGFADSS